MAGMRLWNSNELRVLREGFENGLSINELSNKLDVSSVEIVRKAKEKGYIKIDVTIGDLRKIAELLTKANDVLKTPKEYVIERNYGVSFIIMPDNISCDTKEHCYRVLRLHSVDILRRLKYMLRNVKSDYTWSEMNGWNTDYIENQINNLEKLILSIERVVE